MAACVPGWNDCELGSAQVGSTEDDREGLAEHLGCSPDDLRHSRTARGEGWPKPPVSASCSAPSGYT